MVAPAQGIGRDPEARQQVRDRRTRPHFGEDGGELVGETLAAGRCPQLRQGPAEGREVIVRIHPDHPGSIGPVDHEGASARDDLMRRVAARVDASAAGDTTAVTDSEALADADRLLDLIGTPGSPDMHLQYLAGMLHWNRWSAMGEAGRASGEIAELLLTPLYFVDRSLLPAQLAEYIDTRRSPETGEAGRYFDCGFALASLAATLDRPVFYDQAVQCLDAAVAGSSGDDPQRFAYLSLLGEVLCRRHEAGGDGGDLERAVEASREACRLFPATGPDLVPQLALLGRALVLTAERSEDPAPLLETVDVLRRALRDAEPTDREEVLDLAVGLLSVGAGRPHTDRAVDPGFAAEVVGTAREALLASTPDDPRHLVRTAHLGLALALGGDPTATGEAVRLLCVAIRGLPPAEHARQAALSALRNTLLLDAVTPLDAGEFDLASAVAEEAAAASDPDDPDHYMCLAARAAALLRQWARGSDDRVRARLVEATRDLAAAAPSEADRSRILDGMPLFELPVADEPGPDRAPSGPGREPGDARSHDDHVARVDRGRTGQPGAAADVAGRSGPHAPAAVRLATRARTRRRGHRRPSPSAHVDRALPRPP